MANKKRVSAKATKETQKKFTRPVKSPKREMKQVSKQLKEVRKPIYKLNRKIKTAPSKYYKAKYRKELKEYTAKTTPSITNLLSQRYDLKKMDREFSSLKSEKRRLNRELEDIKSKIRKAKKRKDRKAIGDLALEHANRAMKIKDIDEAVGLRKMIKEQRGEPSFDSKQPQGFQSDPNNPYAFWQGVRRFDDDVKSGHWKYIIVGGNRYSGKRPIETSAAGKEYFSQIDADSLTQIFRYINNNSLTVKFIVNYDTAPNK